MARPSADDRLRRLLALVPWVVAAEGPTVAEVCTRFGMTEAELLADLDLVFLCGVHPFTPDTLMDFELQDGRVWIRYADWFRRPLRLTPEEGLALVAAGATLLAVPGSDPAGPLARALGKIAGVLGVDASTSLEVDLGAAPSGVLDTLRAAIEGPGRSRSTTTPTAATSAPAGPSTPGPSTPRTASGTSRAGATWPRPSAASGSTGSGASTCSTPRSCGPPRPAPVASGCSTRPPTTPGWSSCSSPGPAGSPSSTRSSRSRSWRAGAAG